jgi:hypothetical protein
MTITTIAIGVGIPPYLITIVEVFISVLFIQFCDVAQVVIICTLFSQIWQYSKYENKKS